MPLSPEAAESNPASDGATTAYLYTIVLVAAIGGFLFGYDLSLISGAIIFLQREFALTAFWSGAVAASAILGCCLGPVVGMWIADHWGRKRTLVMAGFLFLVSSIGCAVAASVPALIAWRFVGGAGVGLASTVSPMYIAEIAPARLRGRLIVVNQLAIVIGLSLSVLVAYAFSFGGHWRWMFASQLLPVGALMAGLMFVPESPRWLAAVGRAADSLRVLAQINGLRNAELEAAEIQESLRAENGGLRELLRPGVRLALVIGVTLMVFQQINGVNMILLYTPTLFMAAGISSAPDAILNSVYIDAWIFLCTCASFWVTHRYGRRTILIVGTIGMAVGHVLMALNFAYRLPTGLTLAAMLIPTGAFTLSLAPVGWVVLAEIFPNRVRAKAMSIATCVMSASSFVITSVFPLVLAEFTRRFGSPSGTFLIFACVCLACAAFVWRLLPETKDKTLEAIGAHWLERDSPRRRECSRVA